MTDRFFLAIAWPLELQYLHAWQATIFFALLAAPIVLLGVRSLKSMGRVRQWTAIGMRLLVLLVFVLIIAGARWVRQNKDAEVIALRDISLSTGEVRDFPGRTLTTSLDDYLRTVADTHHKPQDDRVGVISFGSNPLIDSIPNTTLLLDSRAIRDPGNGTDIAAAIQLALATLQRDTMHRLLLISDGNGTTGDLDSAVSAAAAQHVPIDVMPLNYDVQHEVLVDRVVAPAWKREDEPFTLEVYLTSTNKVPVTGKLSVLHSGQPMDMDPETPGIQPDRHITLQPGSNRELVQVPALAGSNLIHTFHAVFEADHMNPGAGETGAGETTAASSDEPGDTLMDNNTADAFTFVRGKGRVLYVDCVADGRGDMLADALTGQGIHLDHVIGADNFPTNLIEMQNYDAVILANTARGASGLSEDQQKMLATYVHDMGGGLVMIGGDNTFGAGGWQGSKLEEVLPVTMDIPAQRQLPKGALVLIIDEIEQDVGNYWAEQCALKAVDALSAHDDIEVISGSWSSGVNWDYPLGPKGDGERVKSAIKVMNPTDFPSFDIMLQAALHGNNGVGGLIDSDAQQKHVILISDNDPEPAAQSTLDQYVQAKVSVSSVIDFPHPGYPGANMEAIARETHGRVYGPIVSNIAQLPQIFIKEASVIRRNLIYKDHNGIPLHANASNSEVMKGLSSLPPLYGMILTGQKHSPQIELPIVAGKNNDPVLAHWQTGLGKALVWTSDAFNDWSAAWLSSGEYDKFWAQAVRSVSRPPQSADFDVQTHAEDGKGKITVEALSKDSTFLNFLSVGGQVIGPDMKPRSVHLVQTGPGTYTGEYDATDPGNYVAVLNYHGATGASGGTQGGVMLSGMAVNSSPELRDLKSNQSVLQAIADRTGGRMLDPFDADHADLFTRDGLAPTSSPLPIWDILLPILLGLILMDVAVRRIAWDWLAVKRLAEAAAGQVRAVTTTRKVETRQSLDALKRIREEGAVGVAKASDAADRPASAVIAAVARPNPKAKFEAQDANGGVQGDITKVVGGATDKPLPSAPKKIQPKGAAGEPVDSMGGLMAAKRRAQQKIKEKENAE